MYTLRGKYAGIVYLDGIYRLLYGDGLHDDTDAVQMIFDGGRVF